MASVTTVEVPDIGDFDDVPVIEILVEVGDTVSVEDPLVTLESEKASMDVPSPVAGVVKELLVKVGDSVKEGVPLLTVEEAAEADADDDPGETGADDDSGATGAEDDSGATDAEGGDVPPPSASGGGAVGTPPAASARSSLALPDDALGGMPTAPGTNGAAAKDPAAEGAGAKAEAPAGGGGVLGGSDTPIYASPMVRRRARELGIDLSTVTGSGRGGRIQAVDLRAAADAAAKAPAPAGGGEGAGDANSILGFPLAKWPTPDFSKQGPVERVELSKIRRLSATNLHRNWVAIPHVTHDDEADITDLEAFRKQVNAEQAKVEGGAKLTMVALLMKACVASLKAFPDMNSSLDPSGEALIHKHYYHLGFAADTPNGLVVPVIRDVDQKGILDVARDLTELSGKARAGKLSPKEMSGSTFTISSLGGIGGTSFTPIVNAPEVGILGVTRAAMKPVWDGSAFVPRLMVPLSLSYDHRVIDGAAAARFVVHLTQTLSDLRRVLL